MPRGWVALFTSLFMFVHHMEQFNIWVFVKLEYLIACKHSDLLLHRVINLLHAF